MAAALASNGVASIDPFDTICHTDAHNIKQTSKFSTSSAMLYFSIVNIGHKDTLNGIYLAVKYKPPGLRTERTLKTSFSREFNSF